ncbi:MAG: MFS transporter small subunit [Nitritalea sp.]
MSNSEQQSKTSPILIALAWGFVSIPLLWGVGQVFLKTLAIFQ